MKPIRLGFLYRTSKGERVRITKQLKDSVTVEYLDRARNETLSTATVQKWIDSGAWLPLTTHSLPVPPVSQKGKFEKKKAPDQDA
jgi:hypothetical protein